jgi:hypothetical protein
MKKTLLLIAAAGLFSTAALAETVIVSPVEQTQIREYVVKQKTTAATLPADVRLSVGAVLPETVELHTVTGVPSASNYRYVVVDGRTVLVEPKTRKVVQIID